MKLTILALTLLGSGALIATLAGCQKPAQRPVKVYAGAGLQHALDPIAKEFTAQTGIAVEMNYTGSGVLISQVQLDRKADLAIPGDVWYVEQLEKRQLVESKTILGYFVPVIMVAKGNPKNIQTLSDLLRPEVKLGLGDARYCQVGRATQQMFEKAHLALPQEGVLSGSTVEEVAVWIDTGRVDAVIVWDATAAAHATGQAVAIPADQAVISEIAGAVLSASDQKQQAAEFLKFLRGPKAREIFAANGYHTDSK